MWLGNANLVAPFRHLKAKSYTNWLPFKERLALDKYCPGSILKNRHTHLDWLELSSHPWHSTSFTGQGVNWVLRDFLH